MADSKLDGRLRDELLRDCFWSHPEGHVNHIAHAMSWLWKDFLQTVMRATVCLMSGLPVRVPQWLP